MTKQLLQQKAELREWQKLFNPQKLDSSPSNIKAIEDLKRSKDKEKEPAFSI